MSEKDWNVILLLFRNWDKNEDLEQVEVDRCIRVFEALMWDLKERDGEFSWENVLGVDLVLYYTRSVRAGQHPETTLEEIRLLQRFLMFSYDQGLITHGQLESCYRGVNNYFNLE